MLDDRYENLEPDALHLFFENGEKVTFSPREILESTRIAWQNPQVFSDEVKRAVDLEACEICPLRGSVDLCHAIFPVLHFLHFFERHPSYERVTIVMTDGETRGVRIQETTVQNALLHVSILSLTSYCELGHKYHELFYGVGPFLSPDEVVMRLTMNAFWLSRGNKGLAEKRLKDLFQALDVTTRCQMNRIRLITKGDAFLNAFVRTHILTQLPHVNGFAMVEGAFEAHKASLPQELLPCKLSGR